MTNRNKSHRRARVAVLMVLCSAVFAAFFARLAWMQFVKADYYADRAAEASSASYTVTQHAARGIQPGVARRARAAVWPVQRTDARIHSGQGVAKGAGVVGAAIVHQQQLQPGGGIGQRACCGAAQRGCGPVAGNDDRNVAYAHGCSSCRIVL